MSNYIEYNFEITPRETAAEILLAELAECGFESFVDTETGLLAYIREEHWKETILSDIFILQNTDFRISYTHKTIQQINWNEQWEKNFNPIVVNDICTIRAPFHPPFNTQYDIIIEPKMSFGTGHHETTHMMLQYLLKDDFSNKKVLDMGCGTGILAIMASKKGATSVDAIDIDPWCIENTTENVQRNNCHNIHITLGDATSLKECVYNVIIANINRNILLQDIPIYEKSLTSKASLYVSGFYKSDIPYIEQKCNENNLTLVQQIERNNWVALQFAKK